MLLVTVVILQSCNSKRNHQTKTEAASQDIYTCSMHPQVIEHHPGNCPICGMKLIKKNSTPDTIKNVELESLLKPANEFVVASLPVTVPQESTMQIPLNVYGVIEADTRSAGSISARVSGRIEKLYLRYRFQKVEAGQKVAEIYSPELLTAQENLLFLLKNDADNTSFINAAKQKLLLLGMSANELNEVMETGKPLYNVSIYSNYSGHVHDAGMSHDVSTTEMNNDGSVTQELSLKEGMYVTKGQPLFMIMNHHQAWAALQIFPEQQSLIKKGDAVQIIPETDTNTVIKGSVDFIEPFLRNNSKTITVRVYFHNMDMLPLGSQVSANIITNSKENLWLPQSAVLSLGMDKVAFVKSNDGFLAHKITTGMQADNKVEILSGVTIKDTVAVNAQYLVDSESFIKTSSN